MKEKKLDMLTCSISGNLWKVALPIAISSILQILFNSVDSIVIGRSSNRNGCVQHGQCYLGSAHFVSGKIRNSFRLYSVSMELEYPSSYFKIRIAGFVAKCNVSIVQYMLAAGNK